MADTPIDRTRIAGQIMARLQAEATRLTDMYRDTESRIGHFVVDDLLTPELTRSIFEQFPAAGSMRRRKTIREHKYVAAQMDRYAPLLEEAVYAFQDERVVELIGRICGRPGLQADEHLYAGGISRMDNAQFLNPHLDNSHDKDRRRWRALNLLFYVTPDWRSEDGGSLELWPHGMDGDPIVIPARFNRLAVMATHASSWHSVSPILTDTQPRCCVSNYYFSDHPRGLDDKFHVTSFRARPGQKLRDYVLRCDARLRMAVRRVFRRGIVKNKQVYKK